MSMQNPIADMLTRIRNAQAVKMNDVSMPSSKVKVAICKVLKDEGYIGDYRVQEEGAKSTLSVKLGYYQGKPVIEYIKQVSKPSIRSYSAKGDLPRIQGGLGVSIVSTSKGVMTAKAAREQNVGGELLVEVY